MCPIDSVYASGFELRACEISPGVGYDQLAASSPTITTQATAEIAPTLRMHHCHAFSPDSAIAEPSRNANAGYAGIE